jgi:hypothetical protein
VEGDSSGLERRASAQLLDKLIALLGLGPMALCLASVLFGESIVSRGIDELRLDLRPELSRPRRVSVSLLAMTSGLVAEAPANALPLLDPPADREGDQGDQEDSSDDGGDDGDCRHAPCLPRSTDP